MKIPKDPVERKVLYEELTRQCLASRADRFEFYKTARNYYLFGTSDESGAPYNKIESTIETLASFIYSPEGTRFSIHLGTTADDADVLKVPKLSDEITEQWRTSGTHMRFGLAAKWSLVFGSMIIKAQWRMNQCRTYLVEPHQFGVLREDIVDLSDQEAFCMCYTTTKTQLNSDLLGNPRRATIMAQIGKGGSSATSGMSEGMSRLILSNPVGGVSGSIAATYGTAGGTVENGLAGGRASYNYAPRVEADMVDMVDLYVWDDDTQDYQIVSMASPSVVIYDRPQAVVGVAKMPHFVVIRPQSNLYDYFWGDSFSAKLAWLQDWRTEDVANIRNLQKKQSDPPISGSGLTGIAEEKLLALKRAGGILGMNTPTAKIETHAPKMPENVFASLDQIDKMFDDTAGIGHILQGKGESGVRSKGQADLMARLGSSRPKARATMLEECASELATLMLRNVQDHSDQRFFAVDPADESKKLPFIASQFTTDYEVKVDAHSSSPIFVEDRKVDAEKMLEAHVIDRETFLEMYDPPNLQVLQKKLKVLQAKEEKAHEQQMQAQQAQAAQKGGHK